MKRKTTGAEELGTALGYVRGCVRNTPGYTPGIQPKPGERIVKLNTNENPFPPSPKVLEAVTAAANAMLRLYPSPRGDALREEAGKLYGLSPRQVLCGNGSDEILAIIMRAFVSEGETIAFFKPSYSLYPVLAALAEATAVTIPLPRDAFARGIDGLPIPAPRAKVFFLSTPNAPYGFSFPTEWIGRLLESFPGIVVADEAYVDFAPESSLPLLADNPRLIVVRTLSKTFSLAGMRIGFAFAHEKIVEQMMKVKDSYNLSRLAQEAGRAALADQAYLRKTRDAILKTRASFAQALRGMGFTVLPSDANFVFTVPPAGATARGLYDALLSKGFLVRYFESPEIADGVRISIGSDEDMDALSREIKEAVRGDQR